MKKEEMKFVQYVIIVLVLLLKHWYVDMCFIVRVYTNGYEGRRHVRCVDM